MKDTIVELLVGVLAQMGITDILPSVDVPENPAHGDYTTTVSMVLAKRLNKSPLELADTITKLIKGSQNTSGNLWIKSVEIASPGFINITVTEANLITQANRVLKLKEAYGNAHFLTPSLEPKGQKMSKKGKNKSYGEATEKRGDFEHNLGGKDVDISRNTPANIEEDRQDGLKNYREKTEKKRIMVEFAHPNTHKAFHIGHLRNITTGESVVRLLQATGHEVVRVNYQGDVGMHIAKCVYSLLYIEKFQKLMTSAKSVTEKVELLGKAYAAGSQAFEEDENVKKTIGEINKKIYARDPEVFNVYQTTRNWSLQYFENIYKRVGSHFDRYYFESEVYELGKRIVLQQLGNGVFTKSEGAIIFPGEKYNLHNRVFVTGEGNPTYEGKEMGLAQLEFGEYAPDLVIHVVGPEQAGYFQVVFKAIECIFPYTTGKEYHLVYGWVKLKHGKMSSRTGNVVLGEWLLDEAKKEVRLILDKSKSKYTKEDQELIAEKAAVAAVKYAFLRVSTKNEIAFDFAESVNLEGDSGPYLQYTYARCQSVLRKAAHAVIHMSEEGTVNAQERMILRQLAYFPDVVERAAANFSPNDICTYLFTLAQQFNVFYAKHTILGSKEESPEDIIARRVGLTAAVAQVLKNGLYLLGIDVLEKM